MSRYDLNPGVKSNGPMLSSRIVNDHLFAASRTIMQFYEYNKKAS